MSTILHFALVLSLFAFSTAGFCQTPPSSQQISAYQGLHKAAQDNDVQAIKKLVADGVDINAVDESRRTPIHVAAFASNDEALIALAKAGAEMNALESGKYDVVTIAAVANDPNMVSLAIELGNKPGLTTSIYDGTALIAAAHLGHHEVVRRLIEAGAPLDHVNNLRWTALIEAVVLGDGGPNHTKTVEALVNAGADITIGDRDGVTPLKHAQSRGYSAMVEILESAKAKSNN